MNKQEAFIFISHEGTKKLFKNDLFNDKKLWLKPILDAFVITQALKLGLIKENYVWL